MPQPGRAAGHASAAAGRARSYHHGDLQRTLLEATEAILAERGVEGFTLREAARRVGVTPAAPAHHFGSTAGLLTEVALLGFQELKRYLAESGAAAGASAAERICAMGLGYVRFALAYPARFQLMFRKERLQLNDERLRAAGDAAYAELERVVRDYMGLAGDVPLDAATQALMLGAWSTVHGFAHLALDGRFDALVGADGLEAFVRRTLPAIMRRQWP